MFFNTQELQNVWVSHAWQLVDLIFRSPRLFLLHAKDFHGNILAVQLSLPNISETTAGLLFQQLYGTIAKQRRRVCDLRFVL